MAKPTTTTQTSPVPEANLAVPALDDPLAGRTGTDAGGALGPYDQAVKAGADLRARPYNASGTIQTLRQHAKGRMTVWERIDVLKDPGTEPTVLWQNWGPNLDGASLVTTIVKIHGRDVALYGHDFSLRKMARLVGRDRGKYRL